jgi:hypothetical protein
VLLFPVPFFIAVAANMVRLSSCCDDACVVSAAAARTQAGPYRCPAVSGT